MKKKRRKSRMSSNKVHVSVRIQTEGKGQKSCREFINFLISFFFFGFENWTKRKFAVWKRSIECWWTSLGRSCSLSDFGPCWTHSRIGESHHQLQWRLPRRRDSARGRGRGRSDRWAWQLASATGISTRGFGSVNSRGLTRVPMNALTTRDCRLVNLKLGFGDIHDQIYGEISYRCQRIASADLWGCSRSGCSGLQFHRRSREVHGGVATRQWLWQPPCAPSRIALGWGSAGSTRTVCCRCLHWPSIDYLQKFEI